MNILSPLSSPKKRSVFKIAVDLIKADNRIHSKEITVLDKLQTELDLTQEEIDLTHYITLSEAILSINEMSQEQVNYIIDLFNDLMRADSDISIEENILLTALTLSCGEKSREWAKVISVPATESKISDTQIVFLEKEWSENAHAILDDKYDNLLISKAFGDIGFKLFYLPSVLKDLGLKSKSDLELGKQFGLLQKSIGYLTPFGNKGGGNDIGKMLNNFDTTTFFKVVLSAMNLGPESFPFNSFLLIKIREGIVFYDNNCSKEVVDFLCIDISDEVKKRILKFVSNFTEQTFMLPYDGYYKIFYDYLSSESRITSSILISKDLHFIPENIGREKISFQSSPQARTLYLLLLKYGSNGITQDCFNKAIEYLQNRSADEFHTQSKFNIEAVKTRMKELNTDWSILIHNTITIYQSLSTKDDQKSSYLSYILSILKHRSSLKTYISTGFSKVEGLANPNQYNIVFDKEFCHYRVDASPSLFFREEEGFRIPLTASSFWKSLI